MNKSVSALFLALPLALCAGCKEEKPVAAETENSYLRGADGVSAVLVSPNESVRVDGETITFDLRENDADYGTAVTEYRFVNEGENDVTLTMLLPFGRSPEYERRGSAHAVTVNGEEVSCRLRYSYAGSGEFSVGDLKRLSNERRTDAFYTPDLTVTEYVFRVSIPAESRVGGFEVFYHCNPNKTHVAFSDSVRTGVKNGWAKAYISLPEGEHTVCMYAFGEPLPSGEYVTGLYEEGKGLMQTASTYVRETVRTYSFAEFVMRDYGECDIEEVDYYNAYLDMLNACTGSYAMSVSPAKFGEESCMAWYEYNLTVPAGGSAVNTVTAPLYPNVSNKNGGCRYDYAYQLSPMHLFGDCGRLNINVLTSEKLTSPSFAFEGTEEGYVYTCDFLPQGELAFSIMESGCENEYKPYDRIAPAITTAIVMLVIVIVGAATFLVVGIVRHKRNLQKEEPLNGRTEEGKIDLDDEGKE